MNQRNQLFSPRYSPFQHLKGAYQTQLLRHFISRTRSHTSMRKSMAQEYLGVGGGRWGHPGNPRWVSTLSTPRSCGEMVVMMWYLLMWEESAAFIRCLIHLISTTFPCEHLMHCNFEEGCSAQDYASPPQTWSAFPITIHSKQSAA